MQHLSYYARHPQLTRLCEHVWSMSKLSPTEAAELIEASAKAAGITPLDLEMVQPGASVPVPFTAVSSQPVDPYKASVERHLAIIEGGRR